MTDTVENFIEQAEAETKTLLQFFQDRETPFEVASAACFDALMCITMFSQDCSANEARDWLVEHFQSIPDEDEETTS